MLARDLEASNFNKLVFEKVFLGGMSDLHDGLSSGNTFSAPPPYRAA
jgi:hypothetical protein